MHLVHPSGGPTPSRTEWERWPASPVHAGPASRRTRSWLSPSACPRRCIVPRVVRALWPVKGRVPRPIERRAAAPDEGCNQHAISMQSACNQHAIRVRTWAQLGACNQHAISKQSEYRTWAQLGASVGWTAREIGVRLGRLIAAQRAAASPSRALMREAIREAIRGDEGGH